MAHLILQKLASIFGTLNSNSSPKKPAEPKINSSSSDPLWKLVALPKEQYDALYIGTIRSIATNQPTEVINHAIAYASRALKIRRGIILPPNAPPEDIRKQEHLWTYATFLVALARNVDISGASPLSFLPNIAKKWLPKEVSEAIEAASKGKASALDMVFNQLHINDSLNEKKEPVFAFKEFETLALSYLQSVIKDNSSYNKHGSPITCSDKIALIELGKCVEIGGNGFLPLNCINLNDMSVGYGEWVINENQIVKGIGFLHELSSFEKNPVSVRKCQSFKKLLSELDISTLEGEGVYRVRSALSHLISSPYFPPINLSDSFLHQKNDEIIVELKYFRQIAEHVDDKFVKGKYFCIAPDARLDIYSCTCRTPATSKRAKPRDFHAVALRNIVGQEVLSEQGISPVKVKVDLSNYTSELAESLLDYIDIRFNDVNSNARTNKHVKITNSPKGTLISHTFIKEFGTRRLRAPDPLLSIMNKIIETSDRCHIITTPPLEGALWQIESLYIEGLTPCCESSLQTITPHRLCF